MKKRRIEIYSAGCGLCDDTVKLVKNIACSSCDITVLNVSEPNVAKQARALGIRSVSAVVVDGSLAGCCANRGPSEAELRDAGIAQSF